MDISEENGLKTSLDGGAAGAAPAFQAVVARPDRGSWREPIRRCPPALNAGHWRYEYRFWQVGPELCPQPLPPDLEVRRIIG